MSIRQTNRLIFILSIVGFAISGYLAFEYSQTGPITCPVAGVGCEIVRKSQFSKLLGIELPYFGLLFYITVAAISVWLTQKYDKLFVRLRLLVSFTGFAFGIYLTFLEAFIIRAWCVWCVASFIVSLFIFLLCIKSLRSELG